MALNNKTPAERAEADVWYARGEKPCKIVDGQKIYDLTDEEKQEYNRAYNKALNNGDWGNAY